MARILLTGGGGFVAPYIVAALRAAFPEPFSLRLTGQSARDAGDLGELHELDVCNAPAVEDAIAAFQPTHVVHLAGITAVPAAAADPNRAWTVNVLGTLNCARAVLRHAPEAAFVFAGSSQAYGGPPDHGGPLRETDLLRPTSEYGATKAAADLGLGVLAGQGLRVVRLRLFNHTGPHQAETFAAPSFAAQIVRIERGEQAPVIKVGNLDAERDFLDVRDVAEAYVAALARADRLPPGTVLNICSGRGVRIGDLLNQLVERASRPISVEIDPQRWRDNDVPILVGDPGLARDLLEWTPRRDLSRTMADILEARREER